MKYVSFSKMYHFFCYVRFDKENFINSFFYKFQSRIDGKKSVAEILLEMVGYSENDPSGCSDLEAVLKLLFKSSQKELEDTSKYYNQIIKSSPSLTDSSRVMEFVLNCSICLTLREYLSNICNVMSVESICKLNMIEFDQEITFPYSDEVLEESYWQVLENVIPRRTGLLEDFCKIQHIIQTLIDYRKLQIFQKVIFVTANKEWRDIDHLMKNFCNRFRWFNDRKEDFLLSFNSQIRMIESEKKFKNFIKTATKEFATYTNQHNKSLLDQVTKLRQRLSTTMEINWDISHFFLDDFHSSLSNISDSIDSILSDFCFLVDHKSLNEFKSELVVSKMTLS